MGASTPWNKMEVTSETARFLRGTHTLWSRLFDGEHIFTVLPDGQTPGPNDGGYFSIDSALKARMLR